MQNSTFGVNNPGTFGTIIDMGRKTPVIHARIEVRSFVVNNIDTFDLESVRHYVQ
jgi:hypothetical protein